MALSRVKSWIANEVLTASELNAEFNNILNNALSLISPLTGNLNANSKQITNLLLETQAASQSAATEGRVYYQTTEDQVHVDDGGAIRRVPTIASPARGGLVRVSSTANVFSQLAIGSANTVLTSDGTDPAWSGTPTIATEDARTNTVTRPLTVTATTTGSPAANIGTGILLRAESGDENPSDFGALDFVASDVGAGSEDTHAVLMLRVAGRALDEKYRFVSTAGDGFTAIFTHAATADRTYTLPDTSGTLAVEFASGTAERTAGDVTTTSTSLVDLTGASITITTGARRALLGFQGEIQNNTGAGNTGLTWDVDGTNQAGTDCWLSKADDGAGWNMITALHWLTDVLTAASHTFKVQWRVSAGTGTIKATTTRKYRMWAIEQNISA